MNGIIGILKRLEIYVENVETLQYFTYRKLLEVETQYFVIKELYFSPYKIILSKITKEEFILKFLKTDKYIGLSQENIKRFIDYFIKCLREKIDKEII